MDTIILTSTNTGKFTIIDVCNKSANRKMSLFQRIANYLASELITKRLANSQTFQRAALKTHEQVQSSQAMAKNVGEKLAQQQKEIGKSSGKFWAEFKDELIRGGSRNNKWVDGE